MRVANRRRDAALLEGFEPRFADVKAVRMRYFVAGEGPPLVLVHGLSGAAANWRELAPRLARRCRVLVPDLPGHGGSGGLPAAPSLDAYAERLHGVAAREGMLPAAVVGHSLGGVIGLRWAIRRTDDVSALVLAGAAGIGSATRWAQFWVALLGLTRPSKAVAPLRRSIAAHGALRRAVFTRWQVSDPLSLTARAIEALLVATPLHVDVVSAGSALVADDPRDDLARVACPTLVVWGARDRQVPIDDAYEYARRLGAPLRVIADCGHLLIVERPEACLDAIEGFLRGIRPGSGSR
ncbi:MAG: alpha/beta fold hydrolase [Thermoleophilia bacterium]|nr:alpha/beta fold hydrolase [Thermoleophilia bacterium]